MSMRSRRRRWTCVTLVLAVAAAGGCGGTSKGTAVTYAFSPDLDGFISNRGEVQTVAASLYVGDLDDTNASRSVRSVVSFFTGGVPTGSHVVVAHLEMTQGLIVGGPFPSHGVVVVDHVDVANLLEPAEFSSGTLTSGFGTISDGPWFGFRSIDVTAQVQADIDSHRVRSQFRLRFSGLESDGNGAADAAPFASSRSPTVEDRPRLLVTYKAP
jgi:hypothetical protein